MRGLLDHYIEVYGSNEAEQAEEPECALLLDCTVHQQWTDNSQDENREEPDNTDVAHSDIGGDLRTVEPRYGHRCGLHEENKHEDHNE